LHLQTSLLGTRRDPRNEITIFGMIRKG
jgi:hypothetical protein